MERHTHRGPGRREGHQHRPKTATGVIRSVRGNMAYFLGDKDEIEAQISTRLLKTAISGDKVEVLLFRRGEDGLYEGEVSRIVERNKTDFVGTVKEDRGEFFLAADDRKLKTPVMIPHDKMRNAKAEEKVRVKITSWKEWPGPSLAEVLNVLGRAGDNSTEMNSIAIDKGFEIEFPEKVLEESSRVFKENKIVSDAEIAKRRDMRETLTFTIDPKTAKDFDDAISFEPLTNGNYEIGVHIADVSHYVREKSELDKEAYRRGCSVYLPDRTIPMLPFELSDELCSLNEHEEKLAFSAVFEMTPKAEIVSRWFGKTVIRSAKRFTYENAQGTIDDPKAQYSDILNTLNRLAKILRKEKWQKGAIDFEQEEIAFELDAEGRPIRIYKKARLDTHKLVEEYMLLANREVAEFVFKYEKKAGKPFPLPYRIHDFPDPEKIQELAIFVKALGHELVVGKGGSVTGRDMQALFAQVEGKAEEALVKTAAIRSMAKAVYSTKNIGHFGLAFEYYAHFTSPIRRYPDLLVHRILATILDEQKIPSDQFAFYEKAAMHSTDQEIKAAEAERDGRKYKQIEFMKDKVGKIFDGLITGVTEWGIYAEDTETKAEGMIRLATMTDDFYVLEPKNYAIVGQRTKKKYQLGQKIRIKLVSADLERRVMDWQIVE